MELSNIVKKSKAIIVDIDGVVLHYPYWQNVEDFYQHLDKCVAVDWMVHLINCIHIQGIKIIFLTARDQKCQIMTNIQLKQLFDFKYELYMRIQGDLRQDYEIKQDYIPRLQKKYNILFAIDDNERNCEMFKQNKIPALHIK